MRYKLLGPTGLRVSELCLGTMTFGEDFGWGSAFQECQQLFHAFLDQGGNFLDTANFYTLGNSESIIGQLSKDMRGQLVIASKYGLRMGSQHDANAGGSHRLNMVRAVEQSLRRLQTDYIDLYMVHIWDGVTPVEEIMRGLDDLVSAGKVVYTGISDAPAWLVAKGNMLAEWRGWHKFAALQMEYNLLERGIEREILPLAKHDNLAVLAWSPLASGVLTGKYRSLNDKGKSARGLLADGRLNERSLAVIETLVGIAQELNTTPAAVALRWLQYQYSQVIPIVGARRLEQLKDNLQCVQLELGSDHLQRLNEAGREPAGFPYDMLADEKAGMPGTHDIVHGPFKADMLEEAARRAVRR